MSHKDTTNVQKLDLPTLSVGSLKTEVSGGLQAFIAALTAADKLADLFDPALGAQLAKAIAMLNSLEVLVNKL
jgi:hypothetical protein